MFSKTWRVHVIFLKCNNNKRASISQSQSTKVFCDDASSTHSPSNNLVGDCGNTLCYMQCLYVRLAKCSSTMWLYVTFISPSEPDSLERFSPQGTSITGPPSSKLRYFFVFCNWALPRKSVKCNEFDWLALKLFFPAGYYPRPSAVWHGCCPSLDWLHYSHNMAASRSIDNSRL